MFLLCFFFTFKIYFLFFFTSPKLDSEPRPKIEPERNLDQISERSVEGFWILLHI